MTSYCQYCGIPISAPGRSCAFTQANKGLICHEKRCVTSTEEERAHYWAHRRWPTNRPQKALRNSTARSRRRV